MADHRQELLSSARAYAYDDYLAALFSPFDIREDLITLSAYYGELARIPLIVKDETLAHIRFQWWREALEKGAPSGHPIADTLLLLKNKREIPLPFLLSMVDKRSEELDPLLFSNKARLEEYWKSIEIPYFQVRSHLLGCPREATSPLFEEAAELLGAFRFYLRLPLLLARRQSFFLEPQPWGSSELLSQKSERESEGATVEEIYASLVPQILQKYSSLCSQFRRLRGQQKILFLPLCLVRPHLRVLREKKFWTGRTIKPSVPLVRFFTYFMAAKLRRY